MSGQPVPTIDEGLARREAADDRATPADRLTHALRWILVALLVGAAVGAVVLHPKRADFLELRSAVEGGDVTAYGIADEMGWLTVGPLGGSGEPAVVWRDRSGTLRWTDLGTADSVAQSLRPGTETLPPDPAGSPPDPAGPPPDPAGPPPSDLPSEPPDDSSTAGIGGGPARTFAALATERGFGHVSLSEQPGGRLALVPDVAWLLAVLFLLRAPQPRRATRWGWFWVFSIPLGLGILWWLLDEHPWSRRASARPEPLPPPAQRRQPGGDPRVTGGYGFLLLLAAGVAIWLGLGALGL